MASLISFQLLNSNMAAFFTYTISSWLDGYLHSRYVFTSQHTTTLSHLPGTSYQMTVLKSFCKHPTFVCLLIFFCRYLQSWYLTAGLFRYPLMNNWTSFLHTRRRTPSRTRIITENLVYFLRLVSLLLSICLFSFLFVFGVDCILHPITLVGLHLSTLHL